MADHTYIKLNNGKMMPAVGLGTWQAPRGEVGKAVELALNHGVKHIDCASVYGNEDEIGETFEKVFNEGKIKREDVFVVSKLWNNDWTRVRAACQKTLSDLRLKYLDLYLVHSPIPFVYVPETRFPVDPETGYMKTDFNISIRDMWREMEKLVEDGLVRSIGVSNFPVPILRDMASYVTIKPAVNQIEVHPYFTQEGNATICKQLGIHITAYSPLAHGKEGPMNDKLVLELAHKYNVTPAQILIRWCVDKGYSVIPKSTREERIKENSNVHHFKLNEDEVKSLTALNRNFRTCDLEKFWRNFPVYQ